MADASVVINEAAAGVKNLETVWKSVEAYVENSIEQLKDVDNSTLLLQFKMRMQSTVNSWSEVGNITAELVALFEEAQREVNVKVRSVKDPGKELQLQRKKLNNAVIKFDMEYLPELKNSMEQLRRSIQKFDNDIKSNQRIIAGNAQFTGIAAGRGVGFTTGLLLLREGLGMRETPIRPHSWH